MRRWQRRLLALGVTALGLACGEPGGATGQEPGPQIALGEEQTGIATYYDFADGSGACLFDPSPADLDVAALNAEQYSQAAWCGACARVEGPEGTVTVRIVDLCPDCQTGHLDLSPSAFEKIAPLSAGRVDTVWSFVSCGVSGPVEYKYKDGSNPWWTAVQVRNHRLPIVKFEVDKGQGFVDLPRTEYNYFLDESGFGSGGVQVRITASDGQTLLDELPPVQEELVTSGRAQFQL